MSTDIQLIHEGGGRFRCATRQDHSVAVEKLTDGETLIAKLTRPRSGRQLRWAHAMVHAAWENQTAGQRFDTSDHLRKWLLIAAGHCDVKRFPPQAMTGEVARWLKATRDDIDFEIDGDCILAKTARSISYAACDHDTMCAVADKMIDIICDQIVPGTSRADWEPYLGRKAKKPNKEFA